MLAGQSLTGNQTLVSKDGKFELGFFTPGNSQSYYIGIWFKKLADIQKKKTIVWVANRNSPITPTDFPSSEFKLLEDGGLVLLMKSYKSNNSSKIPVWSTNSTTSKTMSDSSIKAVLGEDGNLVIKSSANENIVWQSFEHPTNAYLPGAKIRYNNLTKKSQKLTSWRNAEDPSEGIYSVEFQLDNSISVIWNQSRKYYFSGVWNGHYLSNMPEMEYDGRIIFNFTSYKNGSYFTYFLTNNSLHLFSFLDFSGQMKTIIWQSESQDWTVISSKPTERCQVFAVCGAFSICSEYNIVPRPSMCQCVPGFEQRHPNDWDLLDYSGGCVRKTTMHCSDNDMFSQIPNIELSQISPSAVALVVDNVETCKRTCLQNCSCSAYAYYTNSSGVSTNTRCLLWYGDLLNIEQIGDDKGDEIFIRLVASEDHMGSRMKTSLIWIIVGAAFSGITIIVAITFLFLRKQWIRTPTQAPEQGDSYAFLTAFRYKDLKIATKNFSNKLGSGGFGSVFKGTLPDSTAIAVKKLEGISQDQKQFRNEVSTIGIIQHVNLVRLRGFCSEGRKKMLVYDLMPNGSLDKHLLHQNHSRVLNWRQRYIIAIGIARGLAYLHEKCRDCIIHCDIKPENILLDADFSPKVADFGLAKLLGHEFSRVLTTMRGTVGYLAPEWTSGVAITAKDDVYSYGMVLFEIISGRRNLKQSNDGKVRFYPTWAARKVISEGQPVLSILDNNLEGMANIEELTRAFRVACWCIQEEENQRPSMGQVVHILEGHLEVNPPPIQMHLQAMVEAEETLDFFSE
ncbi:hypothetical protein Scep_013245 [Stephania cephalantha]|uniref:Receptor-like serine/threonine-protein kinase n=1 Tax=Stephania cephalantha TaxID=152367 RepID=A0AAP0P789_9MAGN